MKHAGNDKRRWMVLAATAVFYTCCSTVYAWSILSDSMLEEYNWSLSSTAAVYSFIYVICFVFNLIGGWLQRHVSVRKIAFACAVMFGGGWFLSGFVTETWQLYLTVGLMMGGADGIIMNFSMAIVPVWFPDCYGLANGIITSGAGLGPVLFAPLTSGFINMFGTSGGFFGLGLVAFFLMISMAPFVNTPKGYDINKTAADRGALAGNRDISTRKMLKTSRFYLLWLGYLFSAVAGMAVMSNAFKIGQECMGLSDSGATAMVSVLSLFSFAGRIFWGAVSDKINRYMVIAVNMLLQVIAGGCLCLISGRFMTGAALFLIQFCFGGIMALYPGICTYAFGSAYMSGNWPAVYSGYTSASVLGPIMATAVLENTGSYQLLFSALPLFGIAGIAVILTAARLHSRAYGK